jgi:hypothetical protein
MARPGSDAFLRPYINDYTGLASIYAVVAKAYPKQGVRGQSVPTEAEQAGALCGSRPSNPGRPCEHFQKRRRFVIVHTCCDCPF